MDQSIIPTQHPDPWVNRTRYYAASAVWTLARHGVRIHRSWLDPSHPRDITILFTGLTGTAIPTDMHALVWDEETGWRQGRFESGRPGVRTRLVDATHIGGGVVPTPPEVARRAIAGVSVAARRYRSHADWRDGIDDTLWREAEVAELAELAWCDTRY